MLDVIVWKLKPEIYNIYSVCNKMLICDNQWIGVLLKMIKHENRFSKTWCGSTCILSAVIVALFVVVVILVFYFLFFMKMVGGVFLCLQLRWENGTNLIIVFNFNPQQSRDRGQLIWQIPDCPFFFSFSKVCSFDNHKFMKILVIQEPKMVVVGVVRW